MAGFASRGDMIEAYEAGFVHQTSFRKTFSGTTTAGVWMDMMASPGNPSPYYYTGVPGRALPLIDGVEGGSIFHGKDVSPKKKFLKEMMLFSNNMPGGLTYIFADYLLYYPLIPQDSAEPFPLENLTGLPRNVSGDGVRVMCILTFPHDGAIQTITMNYTNSDGVAGRISPVVDCSFLTTLGTVFTSMNSQANKSAPFLPLQGNDRGVRSIQSVTFGPGNGTGVVAMVLVKPLVTHRLLNSQAPYEKDYFITNEAGAEIVDGACLNFLCYPQVNLSQVALHGMATFVWR